MARICVFGDSIVWGANDSINGGWVDIFKVYFKKTGKFNEVFNLGNSGDDSAKLLERIGNESKVRINSGYKEVDVIIIQIGMNDALFIYSENALKIPKDEFKKNLQKLINIAQNFSSKIIFVSLTPVNETKTVPLSWDTNLSYKNEHIKKYNKIIKSACEKNKIYFIEIFDNWIKTDYKKLLEDGAHPNSKGHQKIFETVKDFLIKNKII